MTAQICRGSREEVGGNLLETKQGPEARFRASEPRESTAGVKGKHERGKVSISRENFMLERKRDQQRRAAKPTSVDSCVRFK